MRRLALIIAVALCAQLIFSSPAQSLSEDAVTVKELNFVFIHGAASNPCSLQLLGDSITELLPEYALACEQANPGTEIRLNILNRCYPNDVDIETWANNLADSIDKHFNNKKDIILVGHSMGGKVALYAVANNIGGLADRVVMVATINSPIKALQSYYVATGGSVFDYCRARWLLGGGDVCRSIAYYDSSEDGSWVGYNKHWLAFISGESAPLSGECDVGGIDGWPRDMDDGLIPISAQYSDGAYVVYYGLNAHSDIAVQDEVAEFIANQILRCIFGKPIECSAFVRSGTFEHRADWLLGTDYWEDVVGEILVSSGNLRHKNESYTEWWWWIDLVGEYLADGERSSYQVSRVNSLPWLTGVKEVRWLGPDDPQNCQLYIRTSAAPRTSVQVEWSIYRRGLLLAGMERAHYEVEIYTGTPLTSIQRVSWLTDDPRDLRMQVWSEAQSPFRWFKARWRVFYKDIRQLEVINEITGEPLSLTTQGD